MAGSHENSTKAASKSISMPTVSDTGQVATPVVFDLDDKVGTLQVRHPLRLTGVLDRQGDEKVTT